MPQTQVIAVEQDMAGSAGEITYIGVVGGLPYGPLTEAWGKAGLDPDLLPTPPTPLNALKRAMQAVKRSRRVLLRPLGGGIKGFALVRETADGRELDYDLPGIVRAEVKREGDGDNTVTTCTVEPASHEIADQIKAGYEEGLSVVANQMIGAWIWGTLASRCHAVSLRDHGGVYYIPPDRVQEWRTYCDVITSVSQVCVYHVPAMKSEDAVDAILAALNAEAEESIKRMAEEVSATDDSALGGRALVTRGRKSKDIREKVKHYEALFSRALPELQTQLDELDADIASAILLTAEGDEDDD